MRMNTLIDRFQKKQRGRIQFTLVLLVLAVAVAGIVFSQLRFPGFAAENETYCGYEEHTHSEDCYEMLLSCGLEEDAENPDAHIHSESCYETVLVCEIPEHVHTMECLSDGTADVETEKDWEATLPDVISNNWAEAVISVAQSQLGYTESEANFRISEDGESRQGYTRYGAWYGNAYGDWCAMFVSFCLHYAGIPEEDFPQASGAYAWTAVLDEKGLYADAEAYTPVPGDLIFFDLDEELDGRADHVGIVEEVETEMDEGTETIVSITAIEGNCADMVRENTYPIDDETILGYGILPENSNTRTYRAESGGVAVSVTVAEDALPKDAVLQVTLYDEDSAEYAEALSLMEDEEEIARLRAAEPETEDEADVESGTEVDGYLTFCFGAEEDTVSGTVVLDICFVSEDGAEVEPETPADVTIDASALLSDYGTVMSLEVWHLEETADGTEPVLASEVSDPEDCTASFTVESFSQFEFRYTCSASGWAGFGANLIDENGNTITTTVTGYDGISSGRYTTTVDMPYTFTIEEFSEHFTIANLYTFLYATVTDPNCGDEEHTFDIWPEEEQVGANELYGNEENPVVSITIDGTAAAENPNYATDNSVSKTWHFTLTYADDTSLRHDSDLRQRGRVKRRRREILPQISGDQPLLWNWP